MAQGDASVSAHHPRQEYKVKYVPAEDLKLVDNVVNNWQVRRTPRLRKVYNVGLSSSTACECSSTLSCQINRAGLSRPGHSTITFVLHSLKLEAGHILFCSLPITATLIRHPTHFTRCLSPNHPLC